MEHQKTNINQQEEIWYVYKVHHQATQLPVLPQHDGQ